MIAQLTDVRRSSREVSRPFSLVVLAVFSLWFVGIAPAVAQSGEIFSDGFESGDALEWSRIVPALKVEILTPATDFAILTATVDVSGTFSGSTATVEVNGVAALVVGNTFIANDVPLVEGENLLVATALNSLGQEATDSVVAHFDSTPTVVTITSPADGFRTTASGIEVLGTISEPGPVDVNGVAAVVVGLSFTVTVPLVEGNNLLVATAGLGMDSVNVERDTTGPVVTITAPLPDSTTSESTAEVSGTLDEPATVTVNGTSATVTGLSFTAMLSMVEGANVLTAEGTDELGNVGTDSVEVTLYNVPPAVTIDTPMDGTRTAAEDIAISGTAEAGTTVRVNGVPAVLTGTSFTVTVPLSEGSNVLVAQATDPFGLTGTASIHVTRDSSPPLVTLLSPQVGAVLSGTAQITTTVTGTVHDAASGTVNPQDCTVTVNGVEAEIANGGWAAFDVPIAIGPGTITVVATDSLGNSAGISRQVVGNEQAGAFVEVVSGDGQNAELGTSLAQPLVVRALDNAGDPVPGIDVTFTVARGDGELGDGELGNGELGNGERVEMVTTDGAGQAMVNLTLGSRSGVATDRVEASAAGFFGTAAFHATATISPLAERRLLPSSGFNQRAAVGSQAPAPLVVLVTDDNGNPIAGDPVTFEVAAGDGLVDGAAMTIVTSNDDGRASVSFTLGPVLGTNFQEVVAQVPGATEQVRFAASAVAPGAPQATAVSGVVLTNENQPIAGVTIHIADADPEVSGTTDAAGHFLLTGAPPGPVHLVVDGSVGPYPTLEFELHLVAGIDNSMDRPVYLPLIDDDGMAIANLTTDVVITRADIPGLSLTIPAGSATFADGSEEGLVQIVPVNSDKIPMLPENGTIPSLPISIQPGSVHFDPPAALRLPNVEGRAPGAVVTLYSFDHDVGEFVDVGTMQVSEDGAFLESEPGQGIVKGGWHYTPPTPAEQRTIVLNDALIRCVDATTCFSCTKIGGKCDCAVKPYNGTDAPIPTPDFDCFLFPTGNPPLGDDDYPCDLVGTTHFTGPNFTPNPGAFPPPGIFKPAGSLCSRLYEPPPGPFANVPAGTNYRCRFPTVDNTYSLPVCCPEGHWDGNVCLNDPICNGNDADGDRLEDCVETNTGTFVDATDTGTDPNNADTDADGLRDGDEVLGTLAGLDLPGMGTNPLRQNILLEYDWFDDGLDPGTCPAHSHRPTLAAVTEVSTAFANSPVVNPDGSTGITMIHDYGQGGLFTGGNLIADPDGVIAGGVNDAEYQAHKVANFAANRQGYFHYALLPHRFLTNSGSSGQAELPGNDLIVSLYCYGSDHNVAHTIMHELGHNLDLRHGGFENCNHKPNYNSVMNYSYQFPGVDSNCTPPGDGVLDYSRGVRITLDENNLNENLGICGAPSWDWNNNGPIENPVAFDINNAGNITCGGARTVLNDHNDWANLSLLGINDGDRTPSPEIIDCDNPPMP